MAFNIQVHLYEIYHMDEIYHLGVAQYLLLAKKHTLTDKNLSRLLRTHSIIEAPSHLCCYNGLFGGRGFGSFKKKFDLLILCIQSRKRGDHKERPLKIFVPITPETFAVKIT